MSTNFLWNTFCTLSLVGIWPRFIEPKLLFASKKSVPIKNLNKNFDGLKILHFGDLHFSKATDSNFLEKILGLSKRFNPDLIAFTGDFISHSTLEEAIDLESFLNSFSAPLGRYCVLGNHDYEKTVVIDDAGDFDLESSNKDAVLKGLKMLVNQKRPTFRVKERVKNIPEHPKLLEVIKRAGWKLLNNESVRLNCGLTLIGFGDLIFGRMDPELAKIAQDFSLFLCHHPDGVIHLDGAQEGLMLSGHTHGGQINLPFLRTRFSPMQHPELVRGLVRFNNLWVHTTRGVGSSFPFRLFSPPEITLLTLRRIS